MEINPEIKDTLKEFKINIQEGTLALLAIYFRLDPERIVPDEILNAINLTKIVEKDYNNGTIKWNIALFEGEQIEWQWVKQWNERWRMAPDRKASNPDVLKRMQDFFRKYPTYRVEDVQRATDAYFKSVSSPQYLKNSAAFIFDGAGAMKKSILLGWCERTADKKEDNELKGKIMK